MNDGMGTVVVHRAFQAVNDFHNIGSIVAVAITHTIQPGALWPIANQKQSVVDPAHALTVSDLVAVRLHFLKDAFCIRRCAEKYGSPLLRDQKPPSRIEGQANEAEWKSGLN